MTAADKLNDIEARHKGRYMPLSLLTGMVRVLYFKRRRWKAEAELDGCGRDPSYERDVARDDYEHWQALHRQAVVGLWRSRKIKRFAA